MIHPSLNISREKLEAICRKYHIRELSIFGSATRADFGPESDVDILVEYEPGVHLGFVEFGDLYFELQELFGREIDLVEGRQRLVNPFRRQTILRSLEPLYVA